MGNEEKRCPCGRTLLAGDNPECQTEVVTIYYCVHGDTAGKPASRVSQAWCCWHEDNEELSAAQMFAWFFSPEQVADSPPESELPEHIREAVSDYVTGLLDERIVGDKLTTALWEASEDYPVFRTDAFMLTVNENLETALSNGLDQILQHATLPALPSVAISGIATDFFLGKESRIIRTASITIEVFGVAVGMLTMNPVLVSACVHSLMNKAVLHAVSTAINQGLAGETTMPTVTDQKAIARTEAADVLVTRQSEHSLSGAATDLGGLAEQTSAASHVPVGSGTQQVGDVSAKLEAMKQALELNAAVNRLTLRPTVNDETATDATDATDAVADARSRAARGIQRLQHSNHGGCRRKSGFRPL